MSKMSFSIATFSLRPSLLMMMMMMLAIRLMELVFGQQQQLSLSPFTALRSVQGSYVCAAGYQPMMSYADVSLLKCVYTCRQMQSPSTCVGVNYRDDCKYCELFDTTQTSFDITPGCRYFTGQTIVGPATVHVNGSNVNVALNQPADQYSTWGVYYASEAVDGDYSSTGKAAYTLAETNVWWYVDIGPLGHYVRSVVLTNDIGPNSYRLDNFFVWLSDTAPTVGQYLNTTLCTLCQQYSGSVPSFGIGYVNCPLSLTTYRYVIVQSWYTWDAIGLTQVEVYIAEY